MAFFIDQLKRKIEVSENPQRIISLVPSQTELLYELGLGDRVIGITKFCIHPQIWFNTKQRVGGTKDFNLDKIYSLKPDLIIANKEENVEDGLTTLMNDFPVWISDIKNLENAKSMIHEIGLITKTTSKAQEIISTITIQFNELFEYITINPILNNKVAYLIWQKPYISIGADTFIADMLSRCSLEPVFNNHSRYPEITKNELSEKNIDLIFLSSEPFPFNLTHKKEMEHLFPDKRIILVDGEYFSWYGSRLKMAPKYFQTLLTSIKD